MLPIISRLSCLAGLLLAGTATAGGALTNASIYTMDDEQPTASAMAWDDSGRIVFVGSEEALEKRFADIEPMDAGGRAVLPGLIDAHGHVMGLGLARLRADLTGAGSVEEVLQRLQAHAEKLPEDAWLVGRGWDQTLWDGGEFPNARDLDRAFPERPVWLVRVDGHAGWANSAAMEKVARDLSGSWQPDGGEIHRDDEGRPSGVFIDSAMRFVSAGVPEPGRAERERALQLALDELASVGLTGVHDMGTSLDDFELFRQREKDGGLTARITAMADGDSDMLDWLCSNGRHAGSHLAAHGVKLYADGALGSRGAALLAEYSDDAGNSGLLFHSDDELEALIGRAMGCGLQTAVHAIGDAANRQVISALGAAQKARPDNPGRHRVEHAQIVHPDDFDRLKEYRLIASMQPVHATSDMRWAGERLGDDRLQGAYAWQTMKEKGIPLALGSDFPVESPNPWIGIHAAVTRQRSGQPAGGWLPEQRLSLKQALEGFTIDAATAGFSEHSVGSLEVGKLADFIVVDANPFSVEPDELQNIGVVTTVTGGRVVFERERTLNNQAAP